MKNWYSNIATGQKVFLYVIASLAAVVGTVSAGNAPILLVCDIPLLVLVYLALGAPKKQPQ